MVGDMKDTRRIRFVASPGLGGFHFTVTLALVRDCSHVGDCAADVTAWVDAIGDRRVNAIDAELLRRCLREYGAWDNDDLADHRTNVERMVWLIACDVRDGNRTCVDYFGI